MKSFEIMFSDLNERAQKEFLDLLGLNSAEEGNWDIVPLAIFETEDDEPEPEHSESVNYLELVEMYMGQGMDEDTACRCACRDTNPNYSADDYDGCRY